MPPKQTVLAFDTSAAHCAAALVLDGEIAAHQHEALQKGQSERLFPMLEEVLAEGGCTWQDITRIGVGVGPGNFTGVRISVSAARGLALSLGIPAIGVTRFEAMALDAGAPTTVLIDARRDQVYAQDFKDGEAAPYILPVSQIPSLPHPAISDFGTGAAPVHPIAQAIARIAGTRAEDQIIRPAPLYLRAADAAPPRDPAPARLS